jgi:aminoglycoside phosphotransferase (APT) family kinase protein
MRSHVVVLHPDRPQVLVGEGAGHGAPVVPSDDPPPSWQQVLAAVRPLVPDGAWPLGPDRSSPGLQVHVVQARSATPGPGYHWVGGPDPRWPESLRQAVTLILDEDAGTTPAPAQRVAWMRRDWWTSSTSWVDDRLAGIGRPRTGALEPREHGAISAIARIPTADGPVWLKAVPPIFSREPAVLTLLGLSVPGRVPRVLAMDEHVDGAYMLMEDAGPVPDEVDEDDRPRLAALLAHLQIHTLELVPRLSAVGCADRSPARLASELARMAHDGFELDLLEGAERKALRRLVPRLGDQLLSLAQGPLPSVLVHGDFHPWNVARPLGWSVDDAVIIDWTDAAIGPIGVDLVTLVPWSADQAMRGRVRRAYASVWAAHLELSVQELESRVAAAMPAAHVVQALAYDLIMRAIEPEAGGQFSGAMASHLRALLTFRP